MQSDEAYLATAIVQDYIDVAAQREELCTPCSDEEDASSTLTWEVDVQADAPEEVTFASQLNSQQADAPEEENKPHLAAAVELVTASSPAPQLPSAPPVVQAPSRKRPGRRRRREHKTGCRETLQAPPDNAAEVLNCSPSPPKQSPRSPSPQPPAQPFRGSKPGGHMYAAMPKPPTPEWLTREANKARLDISRAQARDLPQALNFAPQMMPQPPAPRDCDKPSLNLGMYENPAEMPWHLQRRRHHRGLRQQARSHAGSTKSSKRSAATGSSSTFDRGTGFESHDASEKLPKLVDEEKIQSWRENMVASAMSLARTCDVPLGLLPRSGALGF